MAELGALAGTGTLRLPAGLEGGAFTALLRDDDRQLAAAVDKLVATVTEPEARLIRVGNPLRSPLTLERIMIQVAGPEGEVFLGDDPGLVVHAIAERQREEARVVLLIEQAETLHPKALRSLQAMAAYFMQDEQPVLQVVFAGRPAFRALLSGEELAPLRQALFSDDDPPKPATAVKLPDREPEPNVVALFPATRPVVAPTPRSHSKELDIPPMVVPPRPAAVPALDLEKIWSDDLLNDSEPTHTGMPAAASAPPVERGSPDASQPAAMERAALWRRILVPLLLLVAVTAGSAGAYVGLRGLFYRDVPARPVLGSMTPAPSPSPTSPAGPTAPKPATPPPGATPPKPVQSSPMLTGPIPAVPTLPEVTSPSGTSPSSVPSATDQAARLRRDFDAFLDRSGRNAAALSDAQRGALFNEFLDWRSQNAAVSTDPATSDPRIVVQVPTGSAVAEAMSARILASLGSRPGTVQARRVQESPSRPSIRFFHSADEPIARQTAAWLADTGVTFTLRDLSTSQIRPARGTVEIWLPGRL